METIDESAVLEGLDDGRWSIKRPVQDAPYRIVMRRGLVVIESTGADRSVSAEGRPIARMASRRTVNTANARSFG
jgi:hypothetical protein